MVKSLRKRLCGASLGIALTQHMQCAPQCLMGTYDAQRLAGECVEGQRGPTAMQCPVTLAISMETHQAWVEIKEHKP